MDTADADAASGARSRTRRGDPARADHPSTERAVSDPDICARFGIAKGTLRGWRERHGFPPPSFYVGERPYTWAGLISAWIDSLPRTSPLAGRDPRQARRRRRRAA